MVVDQRYGNRRQNRAVTATCGKRTFDGIAKLRSAALRWNRAMLKYSIYTGVCGTPPHLVYQGFSRVHLKVFLDFCEFITFELPSRSALFRAIPRVRWCACADRLKLATLRANSVCESPPNWQYSSINDICFFPGYPGFTQVFRGKINSGKTLGLSGNNH
jgi:hypothetical protein